MPQRILLFAAFSVTLAFAQAAPSTPSNSKGLDLLIQVSAKYKDPKPYYIESIEERTTTGEYQHTWEKTVVVAAGSPEGRYHYEGRSQLGGAVRVSDGNTVWTYHVSDQRYTAKPASAENPPSIASTRCRKWRCFRPNSCAKDWVNWLSRSTPPNNFPTDR
jgi:outer membrane lipoprotein-sorting protein